jgi:GH24 family phage-related lysozyme (muramidase)
MAGAHRPDLARLGPGQLAQDAVPQRRPLRLPVQRGALASVSFQYGALSVAAPKFWKAAVSQDWNEVSKILKAFGDVYKTRRNKEAAVIDKLIP